MEQQQERGARINRILQSHKRGLEIWFLVTTAALAAIMFIASPENRILAYLALLLCAAIVLLIRQQLLEALHETSALRYSRSEKRRCVDRH